MFIDEEYVFIQRFVSKEKNDDVACYRCAYWHGEQKDSCDAFPKEIPDEIINEFECVCFHMTDVPYGRGGSPLQNLITRGHKETMLTALRMVSELDAGPVYMKSRLSLHGPAKEIYSRASGLCYDHIKDIVENEWVPFDQEGEEIYFTRRTPHQSILPKNTVLEGVYDHIRMLDAPTYPKAFIEYGDYRLEFTDAEYGFGEIDARVRIKCLKS